MKDTKVLVLNKFYFPIAIEDVQTIFGDIFSGSKIPLHIEYEVDRENKTVNLESIDYFVAIDNIDEWLNLGIREYDSYIHTARGPIRIPPVVICSSFDKIIYKKGFNLFSYLLGLLQRPFFIKYENKLSKTLKISNECNKCKMCIKICPTKNLYFDDNKIQDNKRCTLCYRCVNMCPQKAIGVFFNRVAIKQYKGID